MTMNEIGFVLFLAVVVGAAAQALSGHTVSGFLFDSCAALVGAFVGASLATALEAPDPVSSLVGGTPFPVFWGLVGAAMFVGILRSTLRTPLENGEWGRRHSRA